MHAPGDIEIRELSPALLADYLAFFDGDAFADNPGWSSCYCFFNQAPHDREEWRGRTAEQNRTAVVSCIRSGVVVRKRLRASGG